MQRSLMGQTFIILTGRVGEDIFRNVFKIRYRYIKVLYLLYLKLHFRYFSLNKILKMYLR